MATPVKHGFCLLKRWMPMRDAAILDPQLADDPPARVVVSFHKRVAKLRGRFIVLINKESNPELLQVLDAYSVPRVRLDALFQELWPSLDSMLRRRTIPRQITRGAPLVFDSLEPSVAGIRSAQPKCRQLRYESDHRAAIQMAQSPPILRHFLVASRSRAMWPARQCDLLDAWNICHDFHGHR